MSGAEQPYLELRNVSLVRDKVSLLQNISLSIFPGRFYLILGANGSGKTNLLRLLCGLYAPSGGTLLCQGETVDMTPFRAVQLKISYCGQTFELFENLTVLDNLYIGQPSEAHRLFHPRRFRQDIERFFQSYGFHFPLDRTVSQLKPSEKCLLQLARSLYSKPSVLLVDELDAYLDSEERQQALFALRKAQARGCAIVLTTHTFQHNQYRADELITLKNGLIRITPLTGGEIQLASEDILPPQGFASIPKRHITPGKPVLCVEGLQSKHLKDVQFSLRRGEILGVYGLSGSGRSSLLRAITRLNPISAGSIHFSPDEAHVKIGYLPETGGAFSNLPLAQNITITNLAAVMNDLHLIDQTEEQLVYNDYARRLGIRTESPRLAKLSKGNRQKLLLARCLHGHCSVYLLDNPTVYVDGAGKIELYNILGELAAKGAAIMMVSPDLNELLQLCDRILLFADGRIVRDITAADAQPDEVYKILNML